MKNLKYLVIIFLFPLIVWAESSEDKEVLAYSDMYINNTLSLYAGKINMDYFNDSDAYSIGLLLQEDKTSDIKFGLGYTQPASNFDFLSEAYIDKLYVKEDDGVLFFMNYNF